MQTPRSKSIMLYESDKLSIRLEYNKEYVIAHMPVCHFTKEVFQELQYKLEDWWEFFQTWGYNGIWAAIDPNDKKMKRLVTKLEFVYRGSSNGMDIYQYGV